MTPRTDAAHAKTLTPAYEYVGAESEAWEWARTLETELADLKKSIGHAVRIPYADRLRLLDIIE